MLEQYPISAAFRLYLRDRVRKSRRFPGYRDRTGCPTFARMNRDDLIGAVRGCSLDFVALFHAFHKQPESATVRKFKGYAALAELDAARATLSELGYHWHEKTGKWLKTPVW